MVEKDWMQVYSQKNQIVKVLEINDRIHQFGLKLSEEEAGLLVQRKAEVLKEQQRIEFGEGILPRLILAFCDSPHVCQDNFAETLERLQEIFYLYKNESMDELSDDELLEYMRDCFNGECEGSLEYLEDTVLEAFVRDVRNRIY